MTLKKSLEQRFWAKVGKTDDPNKCWIWDGLIDNNGYGRLPYERRSLYAHRVSYELNVDSIPSKRVVHHTCGKRWCVNPRHLILMSRGSHAKLHLTNIIR